MHRPRGPGATVIGSGTKFDNQCHVAHNVEIGENCLFACGAGIAGSTKVGDRVVFGGKVGCADHLKIGDDAVAMGFTGITTDLEGGRVYAGFPAAPAQQFFKSTALFRRLGEMRRDIRALRKAVLGGED